MKMKEIRNVTIFDLETTSLSPSENDGQVIEFGAILYSVEHNAVLSQISSLVPMSSVKTNSAKSINSIEEVWTQSKVVDSCSNLASNLLNTFVENSDYIIAHNKEFDMSWNFANTLSKPWLCTLNDFVWPKNPTNCRTSLINTALNHGITVISAHRAMTDCELIASLFSRLGEHEGLLSQLFNKAIERAADEIIEVVALVSFNEKNKAKSKGFFWDSNGDKSKWTKKIRASELAAESQEWDFEWFEIMV